MMIVFRFKDNSKSYSEMNQLERKCVKSVLGFLSMFGSSLDGSNGIPKEIHQLWV